MKKKKNYSKRRSKTKYKGKDWGYLKGLFRRGKLSAFIEHCERKRNLCTEPDEVKKILYFLSEAYLMKEMVKQARMVCLAAKEIGEDANVRYYFSKVYIAEKDLNKALQLRKQNVKEFPFSPLYHYQLGKLYEIMDQQEEALTQYRWASKLTSRNVRFDVCVIKVLLKLKKFEDAEVECKKCVEKYSDCVELNILYARILRDLGNDEKALVALRKVIKNDPVIIKLNDNFLGIEKGEWLDDSIK